MSVQASGLILAWVAIVVLALAMSGLVRQVRALAAQQAHPFSRTSAAVGKPAPDLQGAGIQWQGRTSLLIFAAAECQTCLDRLEEFESMAERDGGDLSWVAVFPGAADGFRPRHVRVLENQDGAFTRLGVPVTPFGAVVTGDGIVSHATALGSTSALQEFVRTARGLG
jgi:hypothetical protein